MDRRQLLRITAVVGVGSSLGLGVVAELVRRARLHRITETRTRMGTVVTMTVVHDDPERAHAMVSDAFGEMDRLERILSRHRPDTPVARLNSGGRVDQAPPELLTVLRHAAAYARRTEGAFDITVAPLLELYAAASRTSSGVPLRSDVSRALELVGHQRVEIGERSVRLSRPGMAVTLDGIAKGWIVDRTVVTLERGGAERVLVDAGGDMTARGEPDGPWRVALQDPADARRARGVVHLSGRSVATSGDYMRTFTEDRRHHHIVDPRTGSSPTHTSSVTVVAASAMEADALSTAALVLGPERAPDVLAGFDGVDALLVAKDGGETRTPGMGRHLGA